MLKPLLISFRLMLPKEQLVFVVLVASRTVIQLMDVVGLAAVGLLGAMVSSRLAGQHSATFFGLDVQIESSESYLQIGLLVAGFFVLKSLAAAFLLRSTTKALASVEARASLAVAKHVFGGDLDRLRKFSRGEIHWTVDGSSNLAFSNLLYAGASLVTEGALFVSVFAVLIAVDPASSLVLTSYFAVLIVAFQILVNSRLKRIGLRMSANNIAVADTVLDLTNTFRETLVLDRRAFFLEKFNEARTRKALDFGLQRFLNGIPRFFVETALILGVVALIAWQFYYGEPGNTMVVIAVFATGGLRLMAALLPLQSAIATIRTIGPQAEKSQELLRISKFTHSSPATRPHSEGSAEQAKEAEEDMLEIKIRNVSFRYPDSPENIIDRISLDIPAGSFTAFIGKSGAGKTTLANLILGVQTPSEGHITIGEKTISAAHSDPGRRIAYVPQNPGIIAGTLAQNVALGVPEGEIDEKQVASALSRASLFDFVKSLPRGIHSQVGKLNDGLSGGQLQRLGLARALYTNPAIIVLDEATSALDPATEALVTEALERLRGSTTLIVIAHRLSTIQNADTVCVIDAGKLVAKGTLAYLRRELPMVQNFINLMRVEGQ